MEPIRRFFLALLPPPDIQAYANQIKQEFADRFASRAAQKSPPHITLQPPFEWCVSELPTLEQHLTEFAARTVPIPLTLNGFAAFPPRVIFINVAHTAELLKVQAALVTDLGELGIVDRAGQSRSFAPHLTVAFRDLTRQNFEAAWEEFQTRSLYFEFLAFHLTLLVHDGNCWTIYREFAFAQ